MTPERFTRSEGPSPPDNAAVLARLVQHIGPRRRFQFALLLGLMLVSALADVVSLGAVLPFLGILTDPDRVLGYPLVPAAMEHWDMSAATDLVLPLTIAFVIAALVAGGLRWLLLWASVRLVYATGVDVSVEAYRRTLHQPSARVGIECIACWEAPSEVIAPTTRFVPPRSTPTM